MGHTNPTVWKLIEYLQTDPAIVDEILVQQERGIRRVQNEGKKTIPESLEALVITFEVDILDI